MKVVYLQNFRSIGSCLVKKTISFYSRWEIWKSKLHVK